MFVYYSYARILAHYPYVVLIAVLVVSLTCLIVTVTIGDRPNFEEPMAVCIQLQYYMSRVMTKPT
jgi:hypothetical protein